MTQQAKNQIKAAVVIVVAISICATMQIMYIALKDSKKAIEGYERRADRATHVIWFKIINYSTNIEEISSTMAVLLLFLLAES